MAGGLALPTVRDQRILFCPHEIGGQMQLMVQELRRRGCYATAATYSQEWFGYVNDIHLNLDRRRGRVRRHLTAALFTAWAAANYDVFHFFWGESLYRIGRFAHVDLPLLRRMGKKIFVHFRGLDLVDIGYFDYLRAKTAGDNVVEPPLSRPEQLYSLEKWRRYSHRMLVSEPDLFRVAPDAVMVQQAIDVQRWTSAREPVDDGVIRVAHAPSMRRKKGTEFVIDAVDQLRGRGYEIELILIENMPFRDVRAAYERCDIGIDQVLYGWYGKVSIELMALGKPVICYIDPELLDYRRDMPIVSANPTGLVAALQVLCDHPERRVHLGRAGVEYVQRYHDVRSIIDQCLALYAEAGACAS